MTDRARESTFNMLHSLGGVDGARVLDLYAGSGSLGLEALSRGAARVTFVEADRRAAATLERNVRDLGFAGRASVRVGSVHHLLPGLEPADLAFCDPPYADDPWADLLAVVPAPLVVAHTESELAVPTGWEALRQRRYGRAVVTILERIDGDEAGDERSDDSGDGDGDDAGPGSNHQPAGPAL